MSSVDLDWKEQELLIIAKAYPEIGRKHGEMSCTAGMTRDGKWMRIYPVPFRKLPSEQQFRKWQWISFLAAKHSDRRLESYTLQPDSIKLEQFLDAAKHLDERKRLILPGVFGSVEEIQAKGLSLGAFLPKEVIDLKIRPSLKERTPAQKAKIQQEDFLSKKTTPLEEKKYEFEYHFRCDDSKCDHVHKLIMLDWETQESYRNFKRVYGDEDLVLEKLQDRWLTKMHRNSKTYFVMGTDHRFGKPMIIGYFSLGISDKLEQFQQPLF